MSPRSEVTRERIQALLEELGRKFLHPARLFLSGGEGLVWRGLRNATKDVDVHYEVDPDHHGEFVDVLRRLKEKRKLSIEERIPATSSRSLTAPNAARPSWAAAAKSTCFSSTLIPLR